jgi:hypothetical protein
VILAFAKNGLVSSSFGHPRRRLPEATASQPDGAVAAIYNGLKYFDKTF